MDANFFSKPSDDSPMTFSSDRTMQQMFMDSCPASPLYSQKIFKIVILGDIGSGKTSLLHRLCRREFADSKLRSFAIEFSRKMFRVNGMEVSACIWDVPNSQPESGLNSILKGADGIVILVDLSRVDGFVFAERVLPQLEEITEDDTPILLLGSKLDLPQVDESLNGKISKVIKNSAQKITFRKSSAKTGVGVSDSFDLLTHLFLTSQTKSSPTKKSYRNHSSTLKKKSFLEMNNRERGKKCC